MRQKPFKTAPLGLPEQEAKFTNANRVSEIKYLITCMRTACTEFQVCKETGMILQHIIDRDEFDHALMRIETHLSNLYPDTFAL